jgi:hypothetical protein
MIVDVLFCVNPIAVMLSAKKHFDAGSLLTSMQKDPLGALKSARAGICYGLFAWCIFVPPAMLIIYIAARVLAINVQLLRDQPTLLFQILVAGLTSAVCLIFAFHRQARERASIMFLVVILCAWAVCTYIKAVWRFHMQDHQDAGYAALVQPESETEPLADTSNTNRARQSSYDASDS